MKSHLLAFPAAERPVCVPYKRKPVRITCRVGAPAPTATVNKQRITKRAFDGRALHGLKFLCRVIFIRQFMFIRRPSERYSPMFSAAERPVCVPYKRKPVRITCRVGAPAPTATVNKQRITKRAFDGRALHGLKFLCRVIFIRQFMFIRRPSERYSPMFSAAERPVCVPYKRKPVRITCWVGASAPTATVNEKQLTLRTFDG